MDTFKDIIEAFGVPRLAGVLDVAQSHVRTMKARDSIPPEYWGAIVENAPDLIGAEIKFDDLRALRRRQHVEAAQ